MDLTGRLKTLPSQKAICQQVSATLRHLNTWQLKLDQHHDTPGEYMCYIDINGPPNKEHYMIKLSQPVNIIATHTVRDQVKRLTTKHFNRDTESSYLIRIPKSRGGPPSVKDYILTVGSCHHPRPKKDTLVHSVLSIYLIVAYCLSCPRVDWMQVSLEYHAVNTTLFNTTQWIPKERFQDSSPVI